MLHVVDSNTAFAGENLVPVVVTLLTVAGAVLVPLLNAYADDLKRAERLTSILDGMARSPERRLVEQVRDDYAVVWALRQSAPLFRWLRTLGGVAYYGGIFVLIVGPLYLLLAPGYQPWFWAYYLGAAALLGLGGLLHHIRAVRQREWMSVERERRGLHAPSNRRLLRSVTREAEQLKHPRTADTDLKEETPRDAEGD
jgi:hypothetical protein